LFNRFKCFRSALVKNYARMKWENCRRSYRCRWRWN